MESISQPTPKPEPDDKPNVGPANESERMDEQSKAAEPDPMKPASDPEAPPMKP